jgi:hypothetical protein
MEMEVLLGNFLQKNIPAKRKPARKGRQKTATVMDATVERFACARDVLKYGVTMEWVAASL